MKILNLSGRTDAATEDDTGRKQWKHMLIDSAIIGGISFFTEAISGPPSWSMLYKALTSFGLAFFIQFAVERGLKRPAVN